MFSIISVIIYSATEAEAEPGASSTTEPAEKVPRLGQFQARAAADPGAAWCRSMMTFWWSTWYWNRECGWCCFSKMQQYLQVPPIKSDASPFEFWGKTIRPFLQWTNPQSHQYLLVCTWPHTPSSRHVWPVLHTFALVGDTEQIRQL